MTDPELIAKFVLVGTMTGQDPFVGIARKIGEGLMDLVEDLERPGFEFMSRCKNLVERFGTKELRGDTIYHSYINSLVAVEWEYASPLATPGMGYPVSQFTVRDSATGETLGHLWNQSGGPRVVGDRARDYLDRLNRLVVLEELAQID